jgi:hypothetical protein
MPDTTAQVAAKGCNSTGITEELAVQLHGQLGKKIIAVVEMVSETRSENRDGKEKVGLSILTIEPAPTADTEDHLRELARAFYYERKLNSPDGQLTIETRDDLEPTVAQVVAEQKKAIPHEFLPALDAPKECEVCGKGTRAKVHNVPDDVAAAPETEADEPEPDDTEPPADEDPTVD